MSRDRLYRVMQGVDERTTRQRIADRLRERALQAGAIANEFEITTSAALSHVRHIARSLDGTDEQLLVAPPECRDCGFSAFDDPVNRPSRCPECKSESVEEPAFRVD
jgi:predicted Zn-ribbon and HTH transcriptional regulator